jgi:hypothetical protein
MDSGGARGEEEDFSLGGSTLEFATAGSAGSGGETLDCEGFCGSVSIYIRLLAPNADCLGWNWLFDRRGHRVVEVHTDRDAWYRS